MLLERQFRKMDFLAENMPERSGEPVDKNSMAAYEI
jgi:hypothetical protein